MDLYLIDATIDELEHGETTFATCERLASLYIIKEHFNQYPPVLKGLYTEIEEELNDIAPQYKTYCEIKREYQLGRTTKEAVITSMRGVCKEIEDFIKILYSSTDMPEEREQLNLLINKIYNKNA